MKTIRGKITIFFIICLLFVGVLTGLYYENTIPLRQKLVTIENFDDLLNDILELRRYEKNFTYYHDTESLDESVFYLFKIEDAYKRLAGDITQVVGPDECMRFSRNLVDYKHALEQNMGSIKAGTGNTGLEAIRAKGKALVDFAQGLIKVKRKRIDRVLNRSLIFPLVAIVAFLILIAVVIQLLNRGILRPLSLVERATEEVAKETFTPISSPTGKSDEISRLIAGFNKMALELESRQEQLLQSRKMASIGTLTSGIAHELNNPINNISLVVESLMEDDETMGHSERMRLYEDLMNQADRSSEIVKNLLEFSRARHPHLEEVSLERLVDKTVRLVENEMRLQHITFRKEVRGNIPDLKMDKSGIQQVLINLFLNAIHAIKQDGEIKVVLELDPGKGKIRLDVGDTGEGIPPEHLQSIFDPFFSTKKEGEGTGLGLSVSYNIIQKHGGRIEVKSQVGQGTCFSIFLPLRVEST
jgi:two-component system, NtrC family, sensor kinase